jgi:hypothetical protein
MMIMELKCITHPQYVDLNVARSFKDRNKTFREAGYRFASSHLQRNPFQRKKGRANAPPTSNS